MVFMIVRKNSFRLYTPEDSVNDRLYMTETEVLNDFERLQLQFCEKLDIAGCY